MKNDDEPFGHFAPTYSTLFMRVLTQIGIGRRYARKWLRKKWRTVDVSRGGINYRLHIDKNFTDSRILTVPKCPDGKELAFIADALRRSGAPAGERVFVDVGANTGYYTLNAIKQGYAKAIAIEPNPPVADAFLYNIRINGFDDKVHFEPLCVGEGESVSLFVDNENWGGSSVVNPRRDAQPVSVPSKSLLAIMEEQSVTQITALKIDVEGYEDKVLLPFFRSAPREWLP